MFYIVEGKGLKIIIQANIVGQQKGGESFDQKVQIFLLLSPPLHPRGARGRLGWPRCQRSAPPPPQPCVSRESN